MIRAGSISVTLGGRPILRDLSVEVAPGEMVAVLGPNGSGKSTLVRTLAGLIAPSSGRVFLRGRPLDATSPRDVARVLAVVGQSGGIAPAMTVEQHVALGRHPHRSRWSFLATHPDDSAVIADAMRLCDVGHLAHRTVETLSGGERQRVRVATALAQQPRVLILDEPLAGLDIEHQLDLLALIRTLNTRGITIIAVLHDLDLALRYFARAIVVHRGALAADGSPEAVLNRETLDGIFGVDGCVSRDAVRGLPLVICERRVLSRSLSMHHHPHPVSSTSPTPHTSPTAATDGLAFRLKSGTQDLHERAENHEFQRNFAAGRISRVQYGLFLVQMLQVHAVLEPHLRHLRTTQPALRALVTDHHFRYELIRRDLADLGVRHEQCVVHAPTRRFAQFIEQVAKEDPVALVGVLYVKEGATNGNKIIVKQVRQTLGLAEDHASRYLDPHGAEQRKRWMAFKSQLDTLNLTPEEDARVVAAARRTFELFAELSETLSTVEFTPEVVVPRPATSAARG